MRRLIFIILISFCFFSCSKKNKYEENLHHFKSLINDINIYFQDSTQNDIQIHNYYTEDFVFHSYPAGYKKGIETNKSDYIDGFNKMKDANMSINIIHSIYLPGIDETSYKIDGSNLIFEDLILSVIDNEIYSNNRLFEIFVDTYNIMKSGVPNFCLVALAMKELGY